MTEKRKLEIGDDGEIIEGDPILSLWDAEKAKRSPFFWRKITRSIIPAFVIFQMMAFTLLCGFFALVMMGLIDFDQVRCKFSNTCQTPTTVPIGPLTPSPSPIPILAREADALCDQGTTAPRFTRIAYISTNPTDYGAVFLVDYLAPEATCKLFSSSDGIYALAWSPDGKRVAFIGSSGIWLAGADGKNQKLIYRGSIDDGSLDWSPDNKQIAFATLPPEGHGSQNIVSFDVATSSTYPITRGNAHDRLPKFSPDGKRILFVSDRDGNNEIYVTNVDGQNLRRLTNNNVEDTSPAWSPDGQYIIYVSDWHGYSNLFVMTADGRDSRYITAYLANNNQPTWSSDGSQITFVTYRDGNNEIYVMSPSGEALRRLTFSRADDHSPVWVR